MRGQLILIEGLDRAGKLTQCDILSERLHARLMKFPDRLTTIGTLLNQYLVDPKFHLSDELVHLLFLANRWELAAQMEKILNLGQAIVMDRYLYLGIAYSLAKQSLLRILSGAWLMAPDRGLPKPDLTIFLTLSIEEIGKRKGWGGERYEKEDIQRSVKKNFENILGPFSFIDNGPVTVINVEGKSIEDVAKLVWLQVEEHSLDQPITSPIARFAI